MEIEKKTLKKKEEVFLGRQYCDRTTAEQLQ